MSQEKNRYFQLLKELETVNRVNQRFYLFLVILFGTLPLRVVSCFERQHTIVWMTVAKRKSYDYAVLFKPVQFKCTMERYWHCKMLIRHKVSLIFQEIYSCIQIKKLLNFNKILRNLLFCCVNELDVVKIWKITRILFHPNHFSGAELMSSVQN